MRCQARQLDSYSTARHCSTARHTTARHVRSRQNSTARLESSTPRRMQSASTCLDGLDSRTRQLLERLDRQGLDSPSRQRPRQRRGSVDGRPGDSACVCRRLDTRREPSTARQPGLKMRTGYPRRERCRGRWYMVIKSSSYFIPLRTPCGCSLPLRAYDSAHPRREPKDGHNPRLTTAERHRSFARAAVAYVSLSSQLLSGGR